MEEVDSKDECGELTIKGSECKYENGNQFIHIKGQQSTRDFRHQCAEETNKQESGKVTNQVRAFLIMQTDRLDYHHSHRTHVVHHRSLLLVDHRDAPIERVDDAADEHVDEVVADNSFPNNKQIAVFIH